jgi:cytochrome c553
MNKLLSSIVALAALGSVTLGAQAQDAKAGEKKAAMCIGCHNIPGYQASFPEVHKVPMISGQSAKYIASALTAYQKGERKHPTMRGIAGSLTEQDVADLAAFYEQQGKSDAAASAAAPQPSNEVAELIKKGNCASCHGDNFNKPIEGYPKLAGQHRDYLYVALKSYQTSANAQIGRNNAIMANAAQPFTHAQLKQLANYIGSLPGDVKTVPQSRFR